MRIARELIDELIAHALAEAPKECCGLVASKDGEAVHVFRCENVACSEFRFEIGGLEQLRVIDAIRAARWELGAIYHSHTRAEPYPSKLDILTAAYPHVLYLIIDARPEPEEPRIRAFRIHDENVTEATLEVI